MTLHADLKTNIDARRSATTPSDLTRAIALSLAFFILYRLLGTIVIAATGLRGPDEPTKFELFGADIDDWLGLTWSAAFRHPLIPLFLKPFGEIVSRLVGDPVRQGILVNAGFGGTAVGLAYLVFRQLEIRVGTALLLATFYGVSMSQLVFGSLPESYAISACSIVTTFWVFLVSLRQGRLNLLRWIGAGVFSLGVAVATFPQTAVAFAFAMRSSGKKGTRRRATTVFVVAVVAVVVVLLSVQTHWLGQTDLLSAAAMRDEYEDVVDNVSLASRTDRTAATVGEQMSWTGWELARNLLLLDFVGGHPGRTVLPETDGRFAIEYVGHPLRFGVAGLMASAMWLPFWVFGVFSNVRGLLTRRSQTHPRIVKALLTIVAGNVLLLAAYNPTEMFLYTPLTAFPILLLAVSPELLARRLWQAIVGILACATTINNVGVLLQMVE